MTESLRYCLVIAAAAKPWFDKNKHTIYIDGLKMLIEMENGKPFAIKDASNLADAVGNSAPETEGADSALTSISLSCCAAISSLLKTKSGLSNHDYTRELFIDSIDLAACSRNENMEDASVDELLNLPEVVASLNDCPPDLTLAELPSVLAKRPAWACWLD